MHTDSWYVAQGHGVEACCSTRAPVRTMNACIIAVKRNINAQSSFFWHSNYPVCECWGIWTILVAHLLSQCGTKVLRNSFLAFVFLSITVIFFVFLILLQSGIQETLSSNAFVTGMDTSGTWTALNLVRVQHYYSSVMTHASCFRSTPTLVTQPGIKMPKFVLQSWWCQLLYH